MPTKMPERWKWIAGYEGRYKISTFGRVLSVERTRKNHGKTQKVKESILKPNTNFKGYHFVCLRKDGKKTAPKVARLVALAFIPNPHGKPCVNHLNSIRKDNRVENLEWCTYSENAIHSWKMGRVPNHGEKAGGAKLTKAKVLTIRALLKNTSAQVLADRYGISLSNIYLIKSRTIWRHI